VVIAVISDRRRGGPWRGPRGGRLRANGWGRGGIGVGPVGPYQSAARVSRVCVCEGERRRDDAAGQPNYAPDCGRGRPRFC